MLKLIATLIAGSFIAFGSPLDQKDVEYGHPGGKPLLLDLHVPDGHGPFVAAIIVHGGGFDQGDKETYVKPLFAPLSSGAPVRPA